MIKKNASYADKLVYHNFVRLQKEIGNWVKCYNDMKGNAEIENKINTDIEIKIMIGEASEEEIKEYNKIRRVKVPKEFYRIMKKMTDLNDNGDNQDDEDKPSWL